MTGIPYQLNLFLILKELRLKVIIQCLTLMVPGLYSSLAKKSIFMITELENRKCIRIVRVRIIGYAVLRLSIINSFQLVALMEVF